MKFELGMLAFFVWAAAKAAAPSITGISMVGGYPRLCIQSDLASTNQIQCKPNLSQANWWPVTDVCVTQSPYWLVDTNATGANSMFYRVVAVSPGPTPPPPPAGMALIPAGSFRMGDTFGEGLSNELPVHTVFLSAFYMDTNLVSYAFWQQVYQWALSHGYDFDNPGSSKAANQSLVKINWYDPGANHPVVMINWYDAVKWCNARSEQEGRTPAYYTGAALTTVYRAGRTSLSNNWVNWTAGYRLPTEAEWEKAARGGATRLRFPWGNTISWDQANYYAYPLSAGGYPYDLSPTEGYDPAFATGNTPYTSPVAYFAPNGYGLHDMAGNVYRWCWDWYGSYSSASQFDPRGPASGAVRTGRGGAWDRYPFCQRVAFRDGGFETCTRDNVGFRCVLPASQP